MSCSISRFRDACASSLMHDLSMARCCVGFHALSPSNPFSKRFKKRLQDLMVQIDLLYRDIDTELMDKRIYEDLPF